LLARHCTEAGLIEKAVGLWGKAGQRAGAVAPSFATMPMMMAPMYIELNPEELEAVALESKRTIEIEEFVPKSQIDELYIRDPYYIAPDGEVGQQAFAVIREAIRKEGMVAIGKVVFTSREHIIALEARASGMLGMTLRYPYEVRKQAEYFDEIPDEKVPKDMLD